jgi:hypothetical protein
MKLRLYISFLFLCLVSVVFAVTLPSSPFRFANELYDDSNDDISMQLGVRITNINNQLQTNNNPWGPECIAKGEQGACQDCCTGKLLVEGSSPDNMIYFKYCILACGGESLAPVGSTLWLLPFILVYAGIKRYKNAQN